MPLIACAGVWARSADMRAQAIGALKILRAKAKSARKSLDLRPDIERARCDPKSLLGYIPKIKPGAGNSMLVGLGQSIGARPQTGPSLQALLY